MARTDKKLTRITVGKSIAARFEAGESLKSVAKEYGITITTAKEYMRRANAAKEES